MDNVFRSEQFSPGILFPLRAYNHRSMYVYLYCTILYKSRNIRIKKKSIHDLK